MKATTETDPQKQQRETIEAIARNISILSSSVTLILGGRLNRKALLVLLASSSGLPQKVIDRVLVALADMDKHWLKKTA